MIHFDRESHVYSRKGVDIDSVTRVLSKVGLINSRFYTEASRNRGTAIHSLTEEYDLTGKTSISALKYPGWIDAYREFNAQHKPIWSHIETGVYHPQWGYVGTADRIGTIMGKTTLLDIKSGGANESHWVQVAAYREAARHCLFDIHDGEYLPPVEAKAVALLYIKQTGKFTLKWCPVEDREYRLALRVWLKALEAANEN